MSALARYFLSQGWKVSGSDHTKSEIVEGIKKENVPVNFGYDKSNIKRNIDLVVYTSAFKDGNPELKRAKTLGIKTQTYPQALGELTKKYWTVAISGSHGKSTTSGLISLILVKAGFDPTVIIGAKLKELQNSNFRLGKSK